MKRVKIAGKARSTFRDLIAEALRRLLADQAHPARKKMIEAPIKLPQGQTIADANVLFPLLVQGHGAHEVAWDWWEKQPDGAGGACLLTRLAVVRLLTNRVAMNGAPVALDVAMDTGTPLDLIEDDSRAYLRSRH